MIEHYLYRHKPIVALDCGKLITYSKGRLYIINDSGCVENKLCDLPCGTFQRVAQKYRFFERLLRLEPRVGIQLNEQNILVSFRGACYRVDIITGKIVKEISFRQGMSNPLTFVRVKGVKGFDECIVFGEYWGNKHNEQVKVFYRKIDVNSEWNVLYTFSKNTINHIHNIIPDIEGRRLLILSGDRDSESAFWSLLPASTQVDFIKGGSQAYRACVGFLTDNGFLYATDTPLHKNFLGIYREADDFLEQSSELEGPVIYGVECNSSYIFSSSVEPDSNLPKLKYLLSCKPGPGVKSSSVKLYRYQDEMLSVIGVFQKDFLPMGLFQFGGIQLIVSPNKKIVYGYGIALKFFDGVTIKII